MTEPTPADRDLELYLLGMLPAERAETLDERAVADEVFAERLRAIEHDLADAYVRGELPADERQRYEEIVLATSSGREDVRLARALAARTQPSRLHRGVWVAAAAAVILVAASGVLVLRKQMPAPATTAATPPAGAEPAPMPRPPAPRSFVALSLAAPTRSVTTIPALTVPAGTQDVRLTLRLEPVEFARFRVIVRDSTTGRVAWQGSDITSATDAEGSFLQVTIPSDAFGPGRYAIGVSGVDAGGAHPIGTYPLVVR